MILEEGNPRERTRHNLKEAVSRTGPGPNGEPHHVSAPRVRREQTTSHRARSCDIGCKERVCVGRMDATRLFQNVKLRARTSNGNSKRRRRGPNVRLESWMGKMAKQVFICHLHCGYHLDRRRKKKSIPSFYAPINKTLSIIMSLIQFTD